MFRKDQVVAQREYKCVVCSGRTRSWHRESISVLCVQEGPGRGTERVQTQEGPEEGAEDEGFGGRERGGEEQMAVV